jgi:hypothetical protein
MGNILVNHFTHDFKGGSWNKQARANLRDEGLVRYCLFDFNLSRIFPLDASIDNCRLPTVSVRDWGAPWLHPEEVKFEEAELDPFKFDVACMGNMLSMYDVCHLLIAHRR